jgi:hypothetical protein
MGITARQAAVFGSGLVLGVAAVGAWVVLNDRERPTRVAAEVTARPVAAAAAAAAPQARTDCGFEPIAVKGEQGDGQLPLPKEFSGKTGAELEAVLTAGKEAAAAGRARDAEVAFISACRAANEASDQPMRLADAKYQLARHYAQLAQSGEAGKRIEMLQRAEKLYADSAFAFAARHGNGYDKVGFANEGLAAVRQALAQGGSSAQPETSTMGAAADAGTKTKPSTPAPAAVAAKPAPAPATVAAPKPEAPKAAATQTAKSEPAKPGAPKAQAAPTETDVVRAPARATTTAQASKPRTEAAPAAVKKAETAAPRKPAQARAPRGQPQEPEILAREVEPADGAPMQAAGSASMSSTGEPVDSDAY